MIARQHPRRAGGLVARGLEPGLEPGGQTGSTPCGRCARRRWCTPGGSAAARRAIELLLDPGHAQVNHIDLDAAARVNQTSPFAQRSAPGWPGRPRQALDDGPALVERVITRLGIDIQVDVPERVSTAAARGCATRTA